MDAAFYKALGKRIADRRKALTLTQESLAEEAGIGSSYVARIETGTRKPTLDVLGRIAEALGVPLWHLLADERERSAVYERAFERRARPLGEAAADLPAADLALLTQLARKLGSKP
jgi:transcriptional regulator with XRE-family HTH domain